MLRLAPITWPLHDPHNCHVTLDQYMGITCLSHDYHMTVTWSYLRKPAMRIDWRPVGILDQPPVSWTHDCDTHGGSPVPGWCFFCTDASSTVKQTHRCTGLLGDWAHTRTWMKNIEEASLSECKNHAVAYSLYQLWTMYVKYSLANLHKVKSWHATASEISMSSLACI